MKSFQKITKSLVVGLLLISGAAFAQTPDQATAPDALIKMVVSDVMASVKSDPDIQKGNIPKIALIVDRRHN